VFSILWTGNTVQVRGASKIKLKNVNKKRMATARRLIFLEFLKASIDDLITLLFSSLQNSEGGGDGDSGDSCAEFDNLDKTFSGFTLRNHTNAATIALDSTVFYDTGIKINRLY
jgi:hypothetical protein